MLKAEDRRRMVGSMVEAGVMHGGHGSFSLRAKAAGIVEAAIGRGESVAQIAELYKRLAAEIHEAEDRYVLDCLTFLNE